MYSTKWEKKAFKIIGSQVLLLDSFELGVKNYINFNDTNGESGYGIRQESGVMQFKDEGGEWKAITSGANVNADWDAVSGEAEIYNKPTIPTLVNSDWDATSGFEEILNKPTIPTLNILDGTAIGQMSFWDGTKWTYADEMFWDDVKKEISNQGRPLLRYNLLLS